jgi:hypothetical protein
MKHMTLDVAFLAAQAGRSTQQQLTKAMAQQMIKQGQISVAKDFKHYHSLIGQQD